jgi:hypothetical protein
MGQRPRSAILHIGTEKTGTTSIQKMLAARRADLAEAGFCYPSSPGEECHSDLAVYAAPEHALELNGAPFDEPAFISSLTAELAALPASVHTVIFSSEHCHSRLISTDQVRKLQALLAAFFTTVTVVVYLRRQDRMACSSYSTLLKYGFSGDVILPDIPGPIRGNGAGVSSYHYFDFEMLLGRYAAVFGKSAVRPRLFETGRLEQGDVLTDFLVTCGLPPDLAAGARRVNTSIPADGQELLALLNTYLADTGLNANRRLSEKLRDVCVSVAQTQLSGRPRLPSRAAAERFYANFVDMNERIRAAWFPEQTRLFDDDFSQYQEHAGANDIALPQERALNIAFACLAGLVNEQEELTKQHEAAIEVFRTSTCWKLTAPLRAVSGLVKGVIRDK